MEFKGTKGKWVVLEDRVREFEDTRNFRVPICSQYGREINSGYLNAHVYGRNKDQMKANALLISKAPEMLEVLKYFVDNNMLSVVGEEMAVELIKQATEI